MTIQQLIDFLNFIPDKSMRVIANGCDCSNDVVDMYIGVDTDETHLVIGVDTSSYDYDSNNWPTRRPVDYVDPKFDPRSLDT